MIISIIVVRAMAFSSCSVRRLILSTTDKFQEVNLVKYNNFTGVFPSKDVYPSDTYYIESKHRNVLSGCRPVLHSYHT
jgi:hypothetical protein